MTGTDGATGTGSGGRAGRQRGDVLAEGRRRDRGVEVGRERAAGGQAADDEAVVRLDLGGDPRPAELLGPLAPALAHLGAQARIGEELGDGRRDRLGLARRDERGPARRA